MKRSEMLRILARRLSNRDVEDIYEAALDEMKFVQETVLERLPNQPWFLETEVQLPWPKEAKFVELPEDYNGLMTHGGVWFNEAELKNIGNIEGSLEQFSEFGDALLGIAENLSFCCPNWTTLGAEQYGLYNAYDVNTDESIGTFVASELWESLDDTMQEYDSAGITVWGGNADGLSEMSLARTDLPGNYRPATDASFYPDEICVYIQFKGPAVVGDNITMQIEVDDFEESLQGQSTAFSITNTEYAANPNKVYQFDIQIPGPLTSDIFKIRFLDSSLTPFNVLDIRACKDEALISYPLFELLS